MTEIAKQNQAKPAPAPAPASRSRLLALAICVALAVVTGWLYWPVHTHSFIELDDQQYVAGNTRVTSSITWGNIAWAFSQTYASNWHPLTWISHMLDCQLFGLDAGKHHLVNVAFHIANTLLLFLVLQRMTAMRWRSAFVAALFAFHPLHVESVAWVAERKDVLSTFFFLLTIGAYADYVQRYTRRSEAKRWYIFSLVLFACGLMSKPMLVTVPFVLLLLDYWPLLRLKTRSPMTAAAAPEQLESQKPELKTIILEKIPFFILSAFSCGMTVWAQSRGRAIASVEVFPFATRIANSLTAYFEYVKNMVWPRHLSIYYPFPAEAPVEKATWAVAFLVSMSVLMIRSARRRPAGCIGWFWYLGTLVPVIGLLQVGAQSMADRYTYIPLIGLFVAVTWLLADFVSICRLPRTLLATISVTILVACIFQTRVQLSYWQNDWDLFSHALDIDPDNALPCAILGNCLAKDGKHAEALPYYERAAKLSPTSISPYLGMANSLEALGRHEEATKAFASALALNPDDAQVHNNYAAALIKRGDLEAAREQIREARRLNPNFLEPLINAAAIFRQDGKIDEAISAYKDALRLNSGCFQAEIGLGDIFSSLGSPAEAILHYRKALEQSSTNINARIGLGLVLTEMRRFTEAETQFSAVSALDPKNVRALDGLGYITALEGKIDEAKSRFAECLRLDPENPYARFHYAMCLSPAKSPKQAIAEYRRALAADGRLAPALNNLAWLLATHSDPQIRNGREAVGLAERACRLTNNKQPFYLGTLAAAYAEAGRFEEAIATGVKARDLAEKNGLQSLADRNEHLIDLYKAKKPYHE
jgi:tetratricopeptide (TPR) repeat protein